MISEVKKKRPVIRHPLFRAFILFSTIYAVFSRTVDDFLTYTPYMTAFFALVMLYGFMRELLLEKGPNPTLSLYFFYVTLVFIPVSSLVHGVAYYGVWIALKDIYHFALRLIPAIIFAKAFTVSGVLIIGGLLFLFRLRARFMYGLTEVFAGIVVALQKIPIGVGDPVRWDSNTYLFMLTAGVYLIVRGFDNMYIGCDQFITELKAYAAAFFERADKHKLEWAYYGNRLFRPLFKSSRRRVETKSTVGKSTSSEQEN